MTRLILPFIAGTVTWLAASTCHAATLPAKDLQIIVLVAT